MKCPNCGTDMIVEYEFEKGRHTRRMYKCPKCNKKKSKRGKLIV